MSSINLGDNYYIKFHSWPDRISVYIETLNGSRKCGSFAHDEYHSIYRPNLFERLLGITWEDKVAKVAAHLTKRVALIKMERSTYQDPEIEAKEVISAFTYNVGEDN